MSKTKVQPPPEPTDQERLVIGEWFRSKDGKAQIAHIVLSHTAENGYKCYFHTNSGSLEGYHEK